MNPQTDIDYQFECDLLNGPTEAIVLPPFDFRTIVPLPKMEDRDRSLFSRCVVFNHLENINHTNNIIDADIKVLMPNDHPYLIQFRVEDENPETEEEEVEEEEKEEEFNEVGETLFATEDAAIIDLDEEEEMKNWMIF